MIAFLNYQAIALGQISHANDNEMIKLSEITTDDFDHLDDYDMIIVNGMSIHKADPNLPLKPHYLYDTNVIILTLFPGIQENMISNILHTPGLRAVVLKTYGSGNAPQKPWFIELLRDATSRGIIIVNISQCSTGTVEMGRYETGLHLLDAGVISGYDSTVESVLTKLMFLLGHGKSEREIRYQMSIPVAGEFTKS